jgi:hypothetical protein
MTARIYNIAVRLRPLADPVIVALILNLFAEALT